MLNLVHSRKKGKKVALNLQQFTNSVLNVLKNSIKKEKEFLYLKLPLSSTTKTPFSYDKHNII